MRYYELLQLNEAISGQKIADIVLPFLKEKFPGKMIISATIKEPVIINNTEIKRPETDRFVYVDEKLVKLSDYLAKIEANPQVNTYLILRLFYIAYPVGVVSCTVDYNYYPSVGGPHTTF
jgi:hypothetical protein